MDGGKVAVVGAGSAFFGPSVVAGLVRRDDLAGVTLALHDVDGEAVERMGRLAELMIRGRGGDRRVTWTTDLGRALEGADCVVLSVAIDREATWAEDRAIALALGIEHYAENGGPAALFHAGRNLALILPIAREIERRAPDAWLLNYTNPVPRICTALRRYSRVRTIGVCHQIQFGYFVAGVLLADVLGIELPAAHRFRWTDERHDLPHDIGERAREQIHLFAAGLNHFTWALQVVGRRDGRDLYPLLRERCGAGDPRFEPLTREVFRLFGLFPVPGDCHLAEYLPYTHSAARGTWARYEVQMYDFAWSCRLREARAAAVREIVAARDVARAAAFPSERAEDLVSALLRGSPYVDEALNLPNDGAIANLPAGAVVESPVAFLPSGPRAFACGALPEPVAELCRRQVTVTELGVQGIVEGDRDRLREALALDPMVDDPALPDRLLDRYLASCERYLKPFFP